MKYMVIGKKWDPEQKKEIKYIAGEFDEYMNASIFKNAYSAYYSTDAYIVERV